jgi:hypothetical protein
MRRRPHSFGHSGPCERALPRGRERACSTDGSPVARRGAPASGRRRTEIVALLGRAATPSAWRISCALVEVREPARAPARPGGATPQVDTTLPVSLHRSKVASSVRDDASAPRRERRAGSDERSLRSPTSASRASARRPFDHGDRLDATRNDGDRTGGCGGRRQLGRLLDAYRGSVGAEAVVTALVLAAPRTSASASRISRTRGGE